MKKEFTSIAEANAAGYEQRTSEDGWYIEWYKDGQLIPGSNIGNNEEYSDEWSLNVLNARLDPLITAWFL